MAPSGGREVGMAYDRSEPPTMKILSLGVGLPGEILLPTRHL
jgi:hypothetical protein